MTYIKPNPWLGDSYLEFEPTDRRFMIATTAFCERGNVSSKQPWLCNIFGQTDETFVGHWVRSNGVMMPVKFPKDTTRPLTHEECMLANKRWGLNMYDELKDLDDVNRT